MGNEDEGMDSDDDAGCAWMEREPFPAATAGDGGICSYEDNSDPDSDIARRLGDRAGENMGKRRLGFSRTSYRSPCSTTAAGDELHATGEMEVLVLGSMSARISVIGVNGMRVVGEGARVLEDGGVLCKGEERQNWRVPGSDLKCSN